MTRPFLRQAKEEPGIVDPASGGPILHPDSRVPELPTYTATRYLQPLREGGSLPAVVDTDAGV